MRSLRFLARRIAAPTSKTRWSCPKREFNSFPPCLNDQDRKLNARPRPFSRNPKQFTKNEQQDKAASLVEQLFPEETKRYQAQRADGRDDSPSDTKLRDKVPIIRQVPLMIRARDPVKAASPGSLGSPELPGDTTAPSRQRRIIHVKNASHNLTEDDFRRLVPRGEHIEGWRSDRDDIIRVMPVRDPETLIHLGEYYLLFPNIRAAEIYQEHVGAIERIAARNTPQSEFSAIAPQPGHREDGVDIDSVLRAYTIALPTQPVKMTILPPPYTDFALMLVKYNGIPPYQTRNGRTPFEVRFTMEGPQLTIGALRHIIMEDGVARGQPWSGTESKELTIFEWDTDGQTPITEGRARELAYAAARRASSPARQTSNPNLARRTANPIFMLSFPTKEAAQSFVCYWHKRTLEKEVKTSFDKAFAQDAPVADVQFMSGM